jgi:DNA-directed RNA polymerase specialized sigma24 family protein
MNASTHSSSAVACGLRDAERPSSLAMVPQQQWHTMFLRLVPRIRQHAQFRFRHTNPADREDAVQEVIARSLIQFLRLLELGKEHLVFAAPLARYAVAQVRGGRRVGGRLNIGDVSSQYGQTRKGFSLESLNHFDDASDRWQEVLVEDRHATPADVAAARIDVREWLERLPQRSRRLAERLATGESTSGAAKMFGISRSRVSQLRRELHCAWNAFQNESNSALA